MDQKIIVLDIETTEVAVAKGGKIVELGIVELDLATGAKKMLYSKVFNPGGLTAEQLATKWICASGYMTPLEILEGANFQDELPVIQNILDQYLNGATAFNRVFDVSFLKNEGVTFTKDLPCPMLLATPVCKLPHARGGSGYKWPKVQEAWDFFFGKNTDYVELHRGPDDAWHEADIVYELFKRGIFKI